jgi:hypothetical protein
VSLLAHMFLCITAVKSSLADHPDVQSCPMPAPRGGLLLGGKKSSRIVLEERMLTPLSSGAGGSMDNK